MWHAFDSVFASLNVPLIVEDGLFLDKVNVFVGPHHSFVTAI